MSDLDVVSLIRAKRDGFPLRPQELEAFIENVVSGRIPDYQASAMLMAIFFRGMERGEMRDLTRSMLRSGKRLDLSAFPSPKVDKHSTGGVGDKISLVLFPLVAAAGVVVPSIAGRGLGHTGGTIDKLEAIPGFRTDLSLPRLMRQLERVGVAVMCQTPEIAPADGRLYALRDATATVDCPPLIVSSILSKKLAEGIEGLVLDVKVGRGAFMKTMAEAEALALALVGTAEDLGARACALITDMEQPLGRAIGNALEVEEAIRCLAGEGPADVGELTLDLGARMLLLAGKAKDLDGARMQLKGLWVEGCGLRKLGEWIEAQEGDASCVPSGKGLPRASRIFEVKSSASGFVRGIDAHALGLLSRDLGAGRRKIGDAIDPAAGILLCKKAGETVEMGEVLAEIHASRGMEGAEARVRAAIEIGEERPLPRTLVHREVQGSRGAAGPPGADASRGTRSG